jgi:hypothetical protein
MTFDPIVPWAMVVDSFQGLSAAYFDLIRHAMRALLGLQREIQRSLASEFRAAHESHSRFAPLVLMSMAFAFGAVHAVTPGHGKSVVASYFLGQGRPGAPRPRHEREGHRDACPLRDRARSRRHLSD